MTAEQNMPEGMPAKPCFQLGAEMLEDLTALAGAAKFALESGADRMQQAADVVSRVCGLDRAVAFVKSKEVLLVQWAEAIKSLNSRAGLARAAALQELAALEAAVRRLDETGERIGRQIREADRRHAAVFTSLHDQVRALRADLDPVGVFQARIMQTVEPLRSQLAERHHPEALALLRRVQGLFAKHDPDGSLRSHQKSSLGVRDAPGVGT